MDKSISLSIRGEIQRFESVHPSIYSIYDILEHLPDKHVAALIREHVVNIEDSFVNSHEWTLSRSVEELRIGLLGDVSSQKSTFVHRYLTNQYVEDNSPEGGRFKKELVINSKPYLLLIRDEGGPPELEFTNWLDVLLLVCNSQEAMTVCYSYVSRLANYKSLTDLSIVLVTIGDGPYIQDLKKIPHLLHVNVDPVTGKNIEESFYESCLLIINKKLDPESFKKRNKKRISELGSGRVIPKKQGYLVKKCKTDKLKKWKKKYVVLTEDFRLNYYDSINSYMENRNCKSIDLKHSNVKPIEGKKIQINTMSKAFEFEAGNLEERDQWVDSIEKQILYSLQTCNLNNSKVICNQEEIRSILRLEGNNFCADCGGQEQCTWVSINLAVVICIACSGIHRNLGSHISRVRSLELDQINPSIGRILQLISGNTAANSRIYEYSLSSKHISPTTPLEEKSSFIRAKYEKLLFLPSFALAKKEKLLYQSLDQNDFHAFIALMLKFHHEFDQIDVIYKICQAKKDPAYLQVAVWTLGDSLEGVAVRRRLESLELLPEHNSIILNL